MENPNEIETVDLVSDTDPIAEVTQEVPKEIIDLTSNSGSVRPTPNQSPVQQRVNVRFQQFLLMKPLKK